MEPTIIDRKIMRPFVALVPRFVRPNFITAVRLISVPVVAWLLVGAHYRAGFLLFGLSAFSDALDGAVARLRGEVTELGKIFDPFADKLLIITSSFVLIIEFLPDYIFYAILIIESLTMLLAFWAKFVKNRQVEANVFGKLKMICETFGVLLLLLYATFSLDSRLTAVAFWLLIAAVVLAVISLVYNDKNV